VVLGSCDYINIPWGLLWFTSFPWCASSPRVLLPLPLPSLGLNSCALGLSMDMSGCMRMALGKVWGSLFPFCSSSSPGSLCSLVPLFFFPLHSLLLVRMLLC
jgi:hypothetical protein